VKILAVLYLALLALIVKESMSDIRQHEISFLDFLIPAIFALLGIFIAYLTLSGSF